MRSGRCSVVWTSRGGEGGFFDLMGLSEERKTRIIGAVGRTLSYLRDFYIADARTTRGLESYTNLPQSWASGSSCA